MMKECRLREGRGRGERRSNRIGKVKTAEKSGRVTEELRGEMR